MIRNSLSEPSPTRSSGAIKQRRVQQCWSKEQELRILSIDGGGIRGIFPAAFLAGLEERFLGGASVAKCFDIIAGTSTGGIIALGLGAGLTAGELRDLYIDRGREIFPPLPPIAQPFAKLLQLFKFRYDRVALMNVLSESFGDRKLGESEVRLCIPSCDGRHSETYIFKTPHHSDYKMDAGERMVKVGAATSAAPGYYRPLEDGGYTFFDGGVWCNNPTMVGLVDALSCFAVPRERIRILSVGCGNNSYTIGVIRRKFGGLLAWSDIISAAMRFQSQNALGQARLLIGADRILRVDAPLNGKPIHLDDWRRASRELPLAASGELEKHGETVASLFLQESVTPYIPHPLGFVNDNKPEIEPGTGDNLI